MAPINRSALIFIHDQAGSPGDWSAFQTQLRSSTDLFPCALPDADAPAGAYLDTRECFLQAGANVRQEIEAQRGARHPAAAHWRRRLRDGRHPCPGPRRRRGAPGRRGRLRRVGGPAAAVFGRGPSLSHGATPSSVGRLAQYHGADDSIVPLATAQETARVLTGAHVPGYELVVLDNARHSLSGVTIAKIIAELPSVFGVQS